MHVCMYVCMYVFMYVCVFYRKNKKILIIWQSIVTINLLSIILSLSIFSSFLAALKCRVFLRSRVNSIDLMVQLVVFSRRWPQCHGDLHACENEARSRGPADERETWEVHPQCAIHKRDFVIPNFVVRSQWYILPKCYLKHWNP